MAWHGALMGQAEICVRVIDQHDADSVSNFFFNFKNHLFLRMRNFFAQLSCNSTYQKKLSKILFCDLEALKITWEIIIRRKVVHLGKRIFQKWTLYEKFLKC